jgi:hypothetical protein
MKMESDIDLHMKQQFVIEFLNAKNIAHSSTFEESSWEMTASVSTVR